MPDTGPTPKQRPATGPIPIEVTQEQIDEQAASQRRALAKEALGWELIQTMLPVLAPNVQLGQLRYTVGLVIDHAQGSPTALAAMGLDQQ